MQVSVDLWLHHWTNCQCVTYISTFMHEMKLVQTSHAKKNIMVVANSSKPADVQQLVKYNKPTLCFYIVQPV